MRTLMTTRIGDLLEALDQRAPFASAAEWDPVGLQVGRLDAAVQQIAVVHELTRSSAAACIQADIDTVVTYHPLIFRQLRSVTDQPGAEGRALTLAESGIAVVAVHTNWDVARGGTADELATALGIKDASGFGIDEGTGPGPEIGRIGTVSDSAEDLLSAVAAQLGGIVRAAGLDNVTPQRVAVLPGSGGSFVDSAAELGADVMVTGDVSHHEARRATDLGMAVIDPGHAATERPGVRALYSAVIKIAGSAEDFTGTDDSPWEGG